MQNRYVIYTCITGNYDKLPSYKVIDPQFDYICFSNDMPNNSKVGQWLIKNIPLYNVDNITLSRYPKIIPYLVLNQYEYSLWIDSNIVINHSTFYDLIKDLILTGSLMACINHPLHNCIYEDARQCIHDGRDYAWIIMRQIKHLKEEEYPQNNGLFENNVILRKHCAPIIKTVSDMWWHEFKLYSKRDQLSLCYVLWKNNFSPDYLLPYHLNTNNSSIFKRLKHKRSIITKIKTLLKRIINRIYMVGHSI